MSTNDDVAGLSDAQLIAEKNRLAQLFHDNQAALRNDATNAKLLEQENEINARLDRLMARIAFRLKEGAIV
jgi:hypothetical protein